MLNTLNVTCLNTAGAKKKDTPEPVTTSLNGTQGTMFSDKYASVLYWLPRMI